MVRRFDSTKDYYNILGVSRDSTEKQIKKAYRKKAQQHHPDTNGHKSDESMKLINEAWEVLSESACRRNYDDARAGDIHAQTRAHTTRGERDRSEAEEQKRRERGEEKRRGDEEALGIAREIKSKLEYYFKKIPGLREKHFDFFLDSLAGEDIGCLARAVREYRKNGSIFLEDYGVFQHFVNNLSTPAAELEKIIKLSREGPIKIVMPLTSEQIEGMRIRLAFHNSRAIYTKTDKVQDLNLCIFEDEVLMTRYDAIRSNQLTSETEMLDPIYVSRLASFLSEGFKSGDYKMKISNRNRGNPPDRNWMGYWIDELAIQGIPIIQDRKSVLNNLDFKNSEGIILSQK